MNILFISCHLFYEKLFWGVTATLWISLFSSSASFPFYIFVFLLFDLLIFFSFFFLSFFLFSFILSFFLFLFIYFYPVVSLSLLLPHYYFIFYFLNFPLHSPILQVSCSMLHLTLSNGMNLYHWWENRENLYKGSWIW